MWTGVVLPTFVRLPTSLRVEDPPKRWQHCPHPHGAKTRVEETVNYWRNPNSFPKFAPWSVLLGSGNYLSKATQVNRSTFVVKTGEVFYEEAYIFATAVCTRVRHCRLVI
jgi:hypothetical protein